MYTNFHRTLLQALIKLTQHNSSVCQSFLGSLDFKIVHLAQDEQKMFAYHSLVALVFATLKLNEMDRYQHLDKFCNDSLRKNVKLCNKVDMFLHKRQSFVIFLSQKVTFLGAQKGHQIIPLTIDLNPFSVLSINQESRREEWTDAAIMLCKLNKSL